MMAPAPTMMALTTVRRSTFARTGRSNSEKPGNTSLLYLRPRRGERAQCSLPGGLCVYRYRLIWATVAKTALATPSTSPTTISIGEVWK